MGLVTRTIQEAASDLFHFFVLFAIVFLGYACVGSILFGYARIRHVHTEAQKHTNKCISVQIRIVRSILWASSDNH